MRARIFAPLGMIDTACVPDDLTIHPRVAPCHVLMPGGGYRRGVFPSRELLGEGAMISTTDDMLRWQTEQLLSLETSRDSYTVFVEPKIVVEIAYSDIQTSSRYKSGFALRFARVKRYRTDKTAADADTIDTVKRLGVTFSAAASEQTPENGADYRP